MAHDTRAATLPRHMPALDGIRAVAILMVVLTHVGGGWVAACSIYRNTAGWGATFAVPPWLQLVADRALLGVPLFFVVSAFTLTVRAARDPAPNVGRYALRRIARVGPGYWLAGLCYTLAAGLGPRVLAPDGVGPGDLAIAAAFGSAWQGGPSMAVVPGGWSVSCEVAFYIALPFILRVVDGHLIRAVILTAIAACLAEFHALTRTHWGFVSYANPIEEAPVFLLGVTAALAALQTRLPAPKGVAVGLLAFAAIALPLLPIPPVLLPQLPFACCAAVAIALAATAAPTLLASRPMRRIGDLSYSIYLVHFVILAPSLAAAEWLLPASDMMTMLVHFSLTFAASCLLATVTHAFVERPAIRWAAARTALDSANRRGAASADAT